MLKSNPADMRTHLEFLFGDSAMRTLGRLIEIENEGPDGKLNQFKRFAWDDITGAVEYAENQANQRRRVYVGAGMRKAATKPTAHSGNGDVAVWAAAVWDFDNLESAQEGLKRAQELGIPFQLIVQTGATRNGDQPDKRVQCWSKFAVPVTDMAMVSRIQKAGIAVFGSDKSIHDPRRIMRLAGSIAWARKDGRLDEMTMLLSDEMHLSPAFSAEAMLALLDAADPCDKNLAPKPQSAVSPERVQAIKDTLLTSGDVLSIWRKSDEVDAWVADLVAGAEMNPAIYRLGFAAARDGHPADVIEAHLRKVLDASEGHATRPDRTKELDQQLGSIVRRAVKASGVPSTMAPYRPAEQDFPPLDPADVVPLDARARLFNEFAWCNKLRRAIQIATGEMFDQTQLDTRMAEVGNCGDRKNSAWAVFRNDWQKRRDVDGIIFMPTGARIIRDNMLGVCVNTWRRELVPTLPNTPDDEAVKPFLDHAAFVIPDERERVIALDWFAWVIQNQDKKPNWALVLGSTIQGIGKDLFLNPLRHAIGLAYVREINAGELASSFNGWLDGTKLVVVQEMENFERRRTANLMKPLIASPPEYLRVNEKGIIAYEIRNITATIIFSNEHDAVQIATGDRRYFVIWNDGVPRDAAYYAAFAGWLDDGGCALAAAWLLARDVSAFDAKGRAPASRAKDDMRRAARTPLAAWLEDSIADDLVCLEDVRAMVPPEAMGRGGARPTCEAIGMALRKLGALSFERMRMRARTAYTASDRMRIVAVRRREMYADLAPDKIRELFWEQHAKAGGQKIHTAM